MSTVSLWVEQGGADAGPLVVLVHGLGHTGQVWRPLIATLPPTVGWLTVDLPGHGRSPWRPPGPGGYPVDSVAAAVAGSLPPSDRPVTAVGHSFGGVVALALAAVHPLAGVLGFGIKVAWTDEELTGIRGRATRPPKVFATEDEARAAFVRFAGLDGIADPASDLAASGITAVDDGYRLAADPRTMAIDAPDLPALLAAANTPVTLTRGEDDHMVTADQLHAVHPAAATLPGAGHNVHVTHPHLLTPLITPH